MDTQIGEAVVFYSEKRRIIGWLHHSDAPSPPVVVGLHGLFSNADSPKQIALASACAAAGISYLRFHHRGCAPSEGDRRDLFSFGGRCKDLLAAVEWIRNRSGLGAGLGLFGSSLGAAVCLREAERLQAAAVVTFAAPVRSSDIPGAAVAAEWGEPIRQPDRAALTFDLTSRLPGIRRILAAHGDTDTVVPYSHALEIHAAARPPKKLLTLPGGDHRMSRPEHQQTFLAAATEWFGTHLLR